MLLLELAQEAAEGDAFELRSDAGTLKLGVALELDELLLLKLDEQVALLEAAEDVVVAKLDDILDEDAPPFGNTAEDEGDNDPPLAAFRLLTAPFPAGFGGANELSIKAKLKKSATKPSCNMLLSSFHEKPQMNL